MLTDSHDFNKISTKFDFMTELSYEYRRITKISYSKAITATMNFPDNFILVPTLKEFLNVKLCVILYNWQLCVTLKFYSIRNCFTR